MATTERAKALKHLDTIKKGLEEQQQELLERLAATEDINDALEVRHRLDKIQLSLVETFAVRRHLKAAEAVSPPSSEMIAEVDDLLQRLAAFEWQSSAVSAVISTARTLTRAFGKQVRQVEQLG